MNSLAQDLIALFSGRKSAHMGPHLYEGDGKAHWNRLAEQTPSYYVSRDEQKLIKAALAPLAHLTAETDHKTFIDLGPGGVSAVVNKSLPLIRACSASRYEAVDMNRTFAEQSAYAVSNNTGIASAIRITDYFAVSAPATEGGIVYMGGCSIGNLPQLAKGQSIASVLKPALKAVSAHLSSGLALITFDSNHDAATLLAAYQNPANDALIATPFHNAIQTGLLKGGDLEDFRLFVKWDRQAQAIMHCAAPRHDLALQIAGQKFQLAADQCFILELSYKFSADDFAAAAPFAGLELAQILSASETPLQMAVLRKRAQNIMIARAAT